VQSVDELQNALKSSEASESVRAESAPHAKWQAAKPHRHVAPIDEGMTNDEALMTIEIRSTKHERACAFELRISCFFPGAIGIPPFPAIFVAPWAGAKAIKPPGQARWRVFLSGAPCATS